ncbi:hypothetical protein OGAPHI_005248 [Ogataea philodendri]|uniref:Uncharacterized protein n=1 Tax=Ogataea philodendri TaxID=1378263 RepID=A0A9P8T3C0_9ASCO|nr:uncharacterized protein OGAPHI_005248 [Ogataea philodendri]KAH3663845.1 hypothetical protein OGAPHI_005248 [Ogataea philodendri]
MRPSLSKSAKNTLGAFTKSISVTTNAPGLGRALIKFTEWKYWCNQIDYSKIIFPISPFSSKTFDSFGDAFAMTERDLMSLRHEPNPIKLLECLPLPKQLGRRVNNFLISFSLMRSSNNCGSRSKLLITREMASHALSKHAESEYSMATRSIIGKASFRRLNLDKGTFLHELAAMESAFRCAWIVKKSKYIKHAGRQSLSRISRPHSLEIISRVCRACSAKSM